MRDPVSDHRDASTGRVLLSLFILIVAALAAVAAVYPFMFVVPAVMLVGWVVLWPRRRVSDVVWAITAAILGAGVILGLVITFLLTPVTIEVDSGHGPANDCSIAELKAGTCAEPDFP